MRTKANYTLIDGMNCIDITLPIFEVYNPVENYTFDHFNVKSTQDDHDAGGLIDLAAICIRDCQDEDSSLEVLLTKEQLGVLIKSLKIIHKSISHYERNLKDKI